MIDGILFNKSHEYVYEQGGVCVIGLSDFAVEQLGDIVFIELPDTGAYFHKSEVFGTVESVKAASEIYMPVSGKIIEINSVSVISVGLISGVFIIGCNNFVVLIELKKVHKIYIKSQKCLVFGCVL